MFRSSLLLLALALVFPRVVLAEHDLPPGAKRVEDPRKGRPAPKVDEAAEIRGLLEQFHDFKGKFKAKQFTDWAEKQPKQLERLQNLVNQHYLKGQAGALVFRPSADQGTDGVSLEAWDGGKKVGELIVANIGKDFAGGREGAYLVTFRKPTTDPRLKGK